MCALYAVAVCADRRKATRTGLLIRTGESPSHGLHHIYMDIAIQQGVTVEATSKALESLYALYAWRVSYVRTTADQPSSKHFQL